MKGAFLLVAVAAVACRREPIVALAAEPTPDAAGQAYLPVRPAIRCAECHASAHVEWSRSAHARADVSPLYRAMKDSAGKAGEGCPKCHAPLEGLVDPTDLVAREGVTCEVCHSIHSVGENGVFAMALAENVQRATLCDARDHNFHKMGCSPLHGESRFCAACHTLEMAG